jgi:riboflavin biosynthesis pyrimidine reductase
MAGEKRILPPETSVLTVLPPFEVLVEESIGERLPLTDELRRSYGDLRFPEPSANASYVVASFVETLDGVVALGDSGPSGGAEISGGSRHDRLILGLLRAAADVIVVGAGAVRASPRHRWTLNNLVPELTDDLRALRTDMDKPPIPPVCIVTASGQVDPDWPLFRVGQDRVMIVTTVHGAQQLAKARLAASVRIATVDDTGEIRAIAIIPAIQAWRDAKLILLEGGPRLLGRFLADHQLNEIFLTISPQLAGRDGARSRLGLVEGASLAPADPRWARLVSLRRVGSHLFARYAIDLSPT